MEHYYVLDERGDPFPEHDLAAWTRWFEGADLSVARTIISPTVTVLTTFRGVDDVNEPGGIPMLFNTRVFGGVLDGEEAQDPTRVAAIAAHVHLSEWCRVGNSPDFSLGEEDLKDTGPDAGAA